jgi:tetratricopeptide (TPR) repeat protein
MENYQQARSYLESAVRLNPQDAHAAERLETARLVLVMDPFQPRLGSEERARRGVRDFAQALARLEECSRTRGEALEAAEPVTELQKAYARASQFRPKVRESVLRRNSDLLMSTLGLAFEIEELTASVCGPPTGADLALLLIARKQGGAQ